MSTPSAHGAGSGEAMPQRAGVVRIKRACDEPGPGDGVGVLVDRVTRKSG